MQGFIALDLGMLIQSLGGSDETRKGFVTIPRTFQHTIFSSSKEQVKMMRRAMRS